MTTIEREDVLSALFGNSPEAVVIVGLDRRIIEVNPACVELFGYDKHEFVGTETAHFYADREVHSELGRSRYNDSASASRDPFVVHYRRKDGSTFPGETVGMPITDRAGTPTGFIGIIRDISRREARTAALREAKAEAEAAAHAKAAFLANMSHEIRTPMNGVLGMLEVLLARGLDGEHADLVATAHRSANALLSVVNDVLDVSKLEADEVTIEAVPFDLERTVRDTTTLLAVQATRKGIDLSVNVAPGQRRHYRGDGARLSQILSNLIGNAVKFTSEGAVTVTVDGVLEAGGEAVRFEVADTGIGMAPDYLPNLFDRYSQAEVGIARQFGGTGLGLSICKRLVELMGGDIGVKSTVGAGTTFWFTIPLKPCEAENQTPRSQAVNVSSSARRLKVLVAEDQPVNQKVVCAFLDILGHEATVVPDGSAAIDTVASERFDLVLMDVQMPGTDGIEATQAIRERETDSDHIPIIGLTAHAMADEHAQFQAAGMDTVLTKPLTIQNLRRVLEEVNQHAGPSRHRYKSDRSARFESTLEDDTDGTKYYAARRAPRRG